MQVHRIRPTKHIFPFAVFNSYRFKRVKKKKNRN